MPVLTPNLGITELDAYQAQPHVQINEGFENFDKAIAGRFAKDMTGITTYTLTGIDSTNHMLNAFGAPGAAVTWTVQATNKLWLCINDMAFDLTVKTAAGTGIIVRAYSRALLYCDGTNVNGQMIALVDHTSIADGKNLELGSTTGTKIGTATTQKLALWNATPIAQPAGAGQAAVTGTAGATYTATEQTMINDLKTLVNQIRADLVSIGAIKGGA